MATSRLRLKDAINSRLPALIGACASDTAEVANWVNAAQQRLLYAHETSESGFWGAWAELAMNVDRNDPYITLPRGVARIINMDVCTNPVPVYNGFYEYLAFGAGHYPKANCQGDTCEPLQALSRGIVPTLRPITAGRSVRARLTSAADADNLRALITGLDTNNQKVTSLDGPLLVQGEFITFAAPFVTTVTPWNEIHGIQKDITTGPVGFYSVDLLTGDETLLVTMEPGETVAAYQRYYVGGLPLNCCTIPGDATTAQLTVMVKLDFVPAVVPTDYLLVQNIEAIIAECQAIRYSGMDSPGAILKAADRHREAIRYLNGELMHYVGEDSTAISFSPFGSARLSCQRIGALR